MKRGIELPALSVMQPWPHAMFHLGKDCENRTWNLPERFFGRIVLIHAGLRLDVPAAERLRFTYGAPAFTYERGGIVGYAVFGECRDDHTSEWAAPGKSTG